MLQCYLRLGCRRCGAGTRHSRCTASEWSRLSLPLIFVGECMVCGPGRSGPFNRGGKEIFISTRSKQKSGSSSPLWSMSSRRNAVHLAQEGLESWAVPFLPDTETTRPSRRCSDFSVKQKAFLLLLPLAWNWGCGAILKEKIWLPPKGPVAKKRAGVWCFSLHEGLDNPSFVFIMSFLAGLPSLNWHFHLESSGEDWIRMPLEVRGCEASGTVGVVKLNALLIHNWELYSFLQTPILSKPM